MGSPNGRRSRLGTRRIVEHCPITIAGVRILALDERDCITSTSIPDRRGACGPRLSLPAIPSLTVCAMLSGPRSRYAIHQ